MTWHSLPLFMRLEGRPVILLGGGDAADAKRRILERAGATIVGEDTDAPLAIVAIEDEVEAHAAVARLKGRGVLVNAVDRPALCDFTLPAIVDRDPLLVAIGTGGVSAGLAAALRQRLEAILPAGLGRVAETLHAARDALRDRYPQASGRRRAIADMLAPGGAMDVLTDQKSAIPFVLSEVDAQAPNDEPRGMSFDYAQHERTFAVERLTLHSPDPDDLTLRQARLLANADRVVHSPDVPPAILDRARADAARLTAMPDDATGLTIIVDMAP